MYQWEVLSTEAKWMESFILYMWVILLYFNTESHYKTDYRNVRIRSNKVVLKINLGKKIDSCQMAVILEFESLFQAIMHEKVKIWKYNVDFRPKLHVLCSQCSWFFCVISPTASIGFLTAWLLVMSGSLLNELGAVIKFSHFSSHPGTCMLQHISSLYWLKNWKFGFVYILKIFTQYHLRHLTFHTTTHTHYISKITYNFQDILVWD